MLKLKREWHKETQLTNATRCKRQNISWHVQEKAKTVIYYFVPPVIKSTSFNVNFSGADSKKFVKRKPKRVFTI